MLIIADLAFEFAQVGMEQVARRLQMQQSKS